MIALFERNPTQLMNVRIDELVQRGLVSLTTVRALDLSFDEILDNLLVSVERTKATRVVLDSIPGFLMSLSPDAREDFNESLYRMASVLGSKRVTLLMTNETEDRFDRLSFSPYGSVVLADAVIMLRYVEHESELHTVISVIKVRGARHSRQFRTFEITDTGVLIGDGPAPFTGMLQGGLQARQP